MRGKKTGGRLPGSKNKRPSIKGMTRERIAKMLGDYYDSDLMYKDFIGLKEGKDRLLIAEKLMKYILPAMQSTAVDLSVSDGGQSLEDRLIHLGNRDTEDDNTEEFV